MADDAGFDYEDVTVYDLDTDTEEALLLGHDECTFIWSNKEGWPVGVIMSYVWRDGRFWLTASAQRARISAVRRDPRVCVVVTSTGSVALGGIPSSLMTETTPDTVPPSVTSEPS